MSNRYHNLDANPNAKEKAMAKEDVEEKGKPVEKKAKFKETQNPSESVPSLGHQKGAE